MAICFEPFAILVPGASRLRHPVVRLAFSYELKQIHVGLHCMQFARTQGQAQEVAPSRIGKAIAPADIEGEAGAQGWCIAIHSFGSKLAWLGRMSIEEKRHAVHGPQSSFPVLCREIR